MKTNRYIPLASVAAVKLGGALLVGWWCCGTVGLPATHADQPAAATAASTGPSSDPAAVSLLRQMMDFIGNGPAWDAKVRETVWASGREVVGVGTYEQAGGGSGQYNLQITMHDGDGKHRLQQISDGRLAWTRTEIGDEVRLRRVDVGRLEDWVRGLVTGSDLSPRLQVGAWGELLSTIERDYRLRIDTAKLKTGTDKKPQPMQVLIGDLRPERRNTVRQIFGKDQWPALYPTRVHVAVRIGSSGAAKANSEGALEELIPARIEYWSDPINGVDSSGNPLARRRLITLIELYSLRQITPPPVEHFRFENQDADVNFVNETDRYVESYGVQLTQKQRRQLYR